MLKSKLATWDKKRLRFVLALFFLALAIPTAILIFKAYSQLKWEAFHHYRSQAEELSSRIDLRYKELIEIESARSFTDYSFHNVAKNDTGQYLQRSPLSAYPLNSKFPGIVGYFQIDNHGNFTTPLLPPITDTQLSQNKNYGISAEEKGKRKDIQNVIYQILSKNRLVNKSSVQTVEKKDSYLNEQEIKAEDIGESRTYELNDQTVLSESRSSAPSSISIAPAPASGKVRSDKVASEPSVTSQAAFDNLQTKKHSPRDTVSKSYSKGRQRVEDLKLKKQYQKKPLKQKRLLKKEKERSERKIVSRRYESNVLPSYSTLNGTKRNILSKKDTQLRVNMFESEIDAFEFSLLESGQFVLYRKVWRNGLRYIQGLLINRDVFIDKVISKSFYNTNISNASNLTIAYQDEVLSTLKRKSSPRFYASNYRPSDFDSQGRQELQGTLLSQNKLSAALEQFELIFSVNKLPAGPGASVVTWLSIILLLILCGGFFILYILGLKQIKLARQQQDFVSAISHELKTPLTSIRMYGEMLREGWTTEDKRQQYYDYIFDESERLTRLINNVLQLARMTRNELPVDLKEYTVAELIDTVRSKISSQVERAEFKLILACDDSINNIKILADADYFIQIIINLVDNAIKFSSKSEKRQIDISCHLSRNNNIQFTIRDYGPGIKKDQMRKIFHLFYRSENELTRETVGTGIGLSLVQQLVSSMHGKINIINKDPGAEFQLTFKSM